MSSILKQALASRAAKSKTPSTPPASPVKASISALKSASTTSTPVSKTPSSPVKDKKRPVDTVLTDTERDEPAAKRPKPSETPEPPTTRYNALVLWASGGTQLVDSNEAGDLRLGGFFRDVTREHLREVDMTDSDKSAAKLAGILSDWRREHPDVSIDDIAVWRLNGDAIKTGHDYYTAKNKVIPWVTGPLLIIRRDCRLDTAFAEFVDRALRTPEDYEKKAAASVDDGMDVEHAPNALVVHIDGSIETHFVGPDNTEIPSIGNISELVDAYDNFADNIGINLFDSDYKIPKGKDIYVYSKDQEVYESRRIRKDSINMLTNTNTLHRAFLKKDCDKDDDKQEDIIYGSLVFVVTSNGDDKHPDLAIPPAFVQHIRDVVSGLKFLAEHPVCNDELATITAATTAVSVVSVFDDRFRRTGTDYSATPAASSCFLAFATASPGDVTLAAGELSAKIVALVSKNHKISLELGEFFTFLARRRVGFSPAAFNGYVLAGRDIDLKLEDVQDLFSHMMESSSAPSHRFLLLSSDDPDSDSVAKEANLPHPGLLPSPLLSQSLQVLPRPQFIFY